MPELTRPDGTVYEVRRRWLPWSWRRRDPRDVVDAPLDAVGGVDDLAVAVVAVVALVIVLVVAPVVLVVAIAGLELLLLVTLLPAFLLLRWARVLRWPIDVWTDDRLVHEEAVRGWAASHRRLQELAEQVRREGWPA